MYNGIMPRKEKLASLKVRHLARLDVQVPIAVMEKLERDRGPIKRATYVQELIKQGLRR